MSIFCTNFPAMDCPFRPDCRPSPDGGRAYQEQKMNGCRLPSSRSAQRWIRFSCHPHHRGAGRFAVPLFSSSNRAIRSAFPSGFCDLIPPFRAEELTRQLRPSKKLVPPFLPRGDRFCARHFALGTTSVCLVSLLKYQPRWAEPARSWFGRLLANDCHGDRYAVSPGNLESRILLIGFDLHLHRGRTIVGGVRLIGYGIHARTVVVRSSGRRCQNVHRRDTRRRRTDFIYLGTA